MATTSKSIGPREFEDPDLQRLFELLKIVENRADNKSKAVMLRRLAKLSEEVATKLNPV